MDQVKALEEAYETLKASFDDLETIYKGAVHDLEVSRKINEDLKRRLERRVVKERPLHAHGYAPNDAWKADRAEPCLPSMDVFELMEENERLKKNYRHALEEIAILRCDVYRVAIIVIIDRRR